MSKKKLALSLVWSITVAAWLGVIATYLLVSSKTVFVIALTTAAVISEAAVWSTAAVLGLTVIESRKRIWGTISRNFRGNEIR